MNISHYGGLPGISAISQTTEREVWWGREEMLLYSMNKVIDSTTVDAGNTPTTELRAGLLLGENDSDNNLHDFDPDAADGTENVYGVLLRDLNMLDVDGVVEDKYGHVLVGGPLKAADVFIEGTALTSSADEFMARKQMEGRFTFDDVLQKRFGALGGAFSNVVETGTTHTPGVNESGSRFIYTNAASVTVTLPTIHNGLVYEFLRQGDEELVVTSGEGDNVIVGNDLSADSITFTSAGEHIGALVRVEGIRISSGTLKWLMTVPHVPFGTGTAFLTYALGT